MDTFLSMPNSSETIFLYSGNLKVTYLDVVYNFLQNNWNILNTILTNNCKKIIEFYSIYYYLLSITLALQRANKNINEESSKNLLAFARIWLQNCCDYFLWIEFHKLRHKPINSIFVLYCCYFNIWVSCSRHRFNTFQ